jgi:hypothetical protein
MANGPRSIYSRRQRLGPARYDNPLADFLDNLPGYVNQFQQNQLALGRQQLEEQRYIDARNKEAQRYQNALTQQDFNNHMKIYNALDKSSQKQQYLQNVLLKDPRFKDFDLTALNNATTNSVKLESDYDEMSSRYQDIITMASKDQFSEYEDVNRLFTTMKGMLSDYRGTEYERDLANKYNTISALKKDLQEKSGKVISIDDAPFNVKSQYKNLSKLQETTAKAFREAEVSINEIANYNPKTNKFELIDEFSGNKTNEQDLLKRQRTYNLSKRNLDATQAKLGSFIDDNNLRYPEIVTAEKREAMDARNKEMTDWFAENQSYLLAKSEEGGALSEMLYDDLSGVDRYDRYQMLKELVDQEKEFDQMFADLDEGDDQSVVADQGNDNQPVDNSREGADDMEPGVEITDQDVEDVLANVRETTGFYPEGDAPRAEDRQETEPSPAVPIVAEQVQARGDSPTEEVIARRTEQARGTELFPDVSFDSLEESDLKDAKGKDVSFSNPRTYNSQINNMYKKAESISERVKFLKSKKGLLGNRLGMKDDAELFRLENEAKELVDSLVKSLAVKDASVDQSVGSTTKKQKNQRNIKLTATSFLKNKKFSSVFDLEQYFNNLLQ